ncbi:MAG: 3-deoxy-7-phosphoheptulonate synthase [Bdellovibrionota bacterium]
MIIILKKGATEADARPILDQITAAGLQPLYLPGEEKIVIGAIGDERVLEKLQLDADARVERVVPILKPYKLANREFKGESSVVDVAGVKIGGEELVVIAGPCAVETEEQIFAAARAVKAAGAKMFRAGAYKPRTSPYAFQGLEEEGLRLLAAVRKETGLPIVTELISEHDLEKVQAATDMFQIGARNMQNFRLLKAVGATRTPVLLKRGPAASLGDLLMAAEYIMSEGNPNVVLCERGIKSFFSDTRNTLDLSIVPLLKRETHLPVIVDPSHGTGVRSIVSQMSLAGVAAGADGLIIEVHPKPEVAWSDGFQQLSPDEFSQLVVKLRKVADAVDRRIP